MNQSKKTVQMVLAGVMTALIIVMSSVPFLGYIPLGVINATIIHIPVIIGAILLGPKYGAFLGLVFGMTSIIKNTFQPNLTSFVFSPFYQMGEYGGNFYSVIISLVPRILIGVVAWAVYQGLRKLLSGHRSDTQKTDNISADSKKKMAQKRKTGETVALAVAGVAGSLTNTLLVMHMIYFFFGESYLIAGGKVYESVYGAILAIIIGAGVPEAIVSGVLTVAICKVMLRFVKRG
jgi:uncharacterized membrane protein